MIIGRHKGIERGMGLLPGRGYPDLVQPALGLGLLALGQLVEHVACLVYPAALVTRRPEDFAQGSPETQGGVTDGQLRPLLEAAALQFEADSGALATDVPEALAPFIVR